MLINWFTVVAQIINFLILVALLKRYLYKPVLNAIDKREKRIASQLQDAASKEREAGKERDLYQRKNEDFEKQREALMSKAIADAKEERQRLFEQARKESYDLRTKLEQALKEEELHIGNEVRAGILREVFAVSRKALAEMASFDMEEQMIRVFVKRIKGMKDDEKKEFLSDLKSSAEAISIKSAFDLNQSQQDEISKSVSEMLGSMTDITFRFDTDATLIGGIELNSGNYKISWTLSEYLDSIEKNLADFVETNLKSDQNGK